MSQNASHHCYHCGQPVPKGINLQVEIDGEARDMCCTGCQAVAQAIVDNGLNDFYRFRTDKANTPQALVPDELRELDIYDNDSLQKSFVKAEAAGTIREASLILEGVVCAACVWLNEQHVQALPGVLSLKINYSTHRATLKWDNAQLQLSDVLRAISAIGYHAHPFDPGRLQSLQKKEKSAALRRIAIAGLGMMQVMMLSLALYIGESSDMSRSMQEFIRWISMIIATVVVLFASRVFFVSAWRDLKRKRFGMDVPVALAMGAAFSSSVWATFTQSGEIYFDSVIMFTFFLLTGRYLEMMARHKAGQVAEALVHLIPATAHRIKQGQQETIAVSELEIGDRVLIKPGETIPADGVVLEGRSSVNESLLTGESHPLSKTINDSLIGGTTNIESPLQMQVKKVGESTVLSAIIRLLERAQSEKPDLAKLADKVASWFVLALLIVASVVFAAWYWLSPEQAFWVTLSVLVVTCPCALSLATPTALTVATSKLTEKGVLTTRGHALETLSKVTDVVFDKTGTLTYGQLKLVKTHVLSDYSEQQVLAMAVGLEKSSEHPIAKAITPLAEPALMTNIKAVSGKGIQGEWQGKPVRLGSFDYVHALVGKPLDQSAFSKLASTVYLGCDAKWLAALSFEDTLRDESVNMIQQLQQQGIQVHLLSGDQSSVVDHVAKQLNIPETQAKGQQLPNDKLNVIQTLQQQGRVVAMIGDGVNDAPVLAGANVSVAMGSGSQLAQASADMVLLSENLQQLPAAIQDSKAMQSIIKQNFAWALGYNITAIPLAASGLIAPWMAAIGMSMSSLIVVLNALRLKNDTQN